MPTYIELEFTFLNTIGDRVALSVGSPAGGSAIHDQDAVDFIKTATIAIIRNQLIQFEGDAGATSARLTIIDDIDDIVGPLE